MDRPQVVNEHLFIIAGDFSPKIAKELAEYIEALEELVGVKV